MRRFFTCSIVALAMTALASAQVEQRPPSLSDSLEKMGSGGPAPRHDLTGAWTGKLEPQLGEAPPMTPLGQQRFKLNIPDPFRAQSNDPWATCDPFGFPRAVTNETRGITFAQMPDRIVMLIQYERVWRIIWMDGRPLPNNAGAKGGPETRWYGYSVGHWEDDHTLVVETAGVDDRTWVDRRGYPHSVDMRVTERYTRLDHNTMEQTVTVDDPKIYTKSFLVATNRYKWIPDQNDEEQLCVPSEMINYIKTIAIPADEDHNAGKK